MRRKVRILVRSAVLATALVAQVGVVGAYWVCDLCGCHIGHANCWFYDHDDVCHSGDITDDCYFHPRESCSGSGGELE